MIESIKAWTINIVAVIILISFMEILIPDGKMKKYINLVLGFIVMLVILAPIIGVLNKHKDLEEDVFMISEELNKKEYSFISSNIENRQMEQLALLYKDRIKQDIVYRVENKYDVKVTKVDIEISESANGEIDKLELTVSEKKEEINQDTIPIVKIDVSNSDKDEIDKKNNNNNEDNDINIGLRKKIQNDISNIYNLRESSIVIKN